jgi:hypothetical protein
MPRICHFFITEAGCKKGDKCGFSHNICKNPACIARGKQNTHTDDVCGVKDPSLSIDNQRPAFYKRNEEMAVQSMEKAKEKNRPREEAKNALGEILYPLFVEVLKRPHVAEVMAEFNAAHPDRVAAISGMSLPGKITGMHLSEKNLAEILEFTKEVQNWTPEAAEAAAMEAIAVLYDKPAQ